MLFPLLLLIVQVESFKLMFSGMLKILIIVCCVGNIVCAMMEEGKRTGTSRKFYQKNFLWT